MEISSESLSAHPEVGTQRDGRRGIWPRATDISTKEAIPAGVESCSSSFLTGSVFNITAHGSPKGLLGLIAGRQLKPPKGVTKITKGDICEEEVSGPPDASSGKQPNT